MRRTALAAVLLLAFRGPALAEPGQTGAVTLARPLGARAPGLAGAFSAVPAGLDSLSYNPAALAPMDRGAVMTDYTHGIVDDSFGFLGAAQPLTKSVTLTAGLAYYDAGSITLNPTGGAQQTVSVERDWYGLVGGAVELPGRLSVGALAKYYRFTLAEAATARGEAFDAGALWRSPVRGLSFGAAMQNAGPDVKFEQQGDPLPLTLRAGAAYEFGIDANLDEARIGFDRFLVTADAVKARDERATAAAGVEMRMPLGGADYGALRGGYAFNNEADSVSLGLGLRQGRFLFDYALGIKRVIGVEHHFSFGIRL